MWEVKMNLKEKVMVWPADGKCGLESSLRTWCPRFPHFPFHFFNEMKEKRKNIWSLKKRLLGPFFLSFISFYRNERFPHMIDLNARTFSFILRDCPCVRADRSSSGDYYGLTFFRINWWHLLREIMKAINWWAHKARRMWGNLRLTVNSWPGIDGLSVDSSISCTPSIGQEVIVMVSLKHFL